MRTVVGMANAQLHRREVVKSILEHRGDLLVVAGLGSPSWDVAASGDHPLNFTLWGAMGGAVAVGLGVAIAQPDRRVIVITGDGEMLMGIGSLATVGVQGPQNLSVVVLDNERYGETGMQETHTATVVDLVGVAQASGFANTMTVRTRDELDRCRSMLGEPGPSFYCVKVIAEDLNLVLPPRDGKVLARRFRKELRVS